MPPPSALYARLCALPEHQTSEILANQLHVRRRPTPREGIAQGRVFCAVDPSFDGGWCLLEPELHADSDVLVPDVAGWRAERGSIPLDDVGITLVPDWVCEVLSPATVRIDRVVKMPIYARMGVAHVWLVDPVNQTLQVFARLTPDDPRWVVALQSGGDDVVVDPPPFAGLTLPLRRLWSQT